MASRGKTVAGTDGTDHTFREKVASQYRESAKLKRSLRIIYGLMVIPITLLSVHVLRINDTVKLTNQVLPKPEPWEYLYISSLLFNMIGYTSLSRNNATRLSVYFYGAGATTFGAIIWAGASHANEVRDFVMKGRVRSFLFGQPLVILTYLSLLLMLQLNLYGLNYAKSLLKAWKAKGFKSE